MTDEGTDHATAGITTGRAITIFDPYDSPTANFRPVCLVHLLAYFALLTLGSLLSFLPVESLSGLLSFSPSPSLRRDLKRAV